MFYGRNVTCNRSIALGWTVFANLLENATNGPRLMYVTRTVFATKNVDIFIIRACPIL